MARSSQLWVRFITGPARAAQGAEEVSLQVLEHGPPGLPGPVVEGGVGDAEALAGAPDRLVRLDDLGDDNVADLQGPEVRLAVPRPLFADVGQVAETHVLQPP